MHIIFVNCQKVILEEKRKDSFGLSLKSKDVTKFFKKSCNCIFYLCILALASFLDALNISAGKMCIS